ncbi:uncharacterized protein [Pseudochaenichthys georgianus]|uniref:uncharacterized protein n=1 Tax=Pseudochaenichthys georgianus TaxID=52239 RepID=UPI0039C19397
MFDRGNLWTLVAASSGILDPPLPRHKTYGTRGPARGVEPIDFTRSNELKGLSILGVRDPLPHLSSPFPPSSPRLLPAVEAPGGAAAAGPEVNIPAAAGAAAQQDTQTGSRDEERQRKENEEEEAGLKKIHDKREKKKRDAKKAELYRKEHLQKGITTFPAFPGQLTMVQAITTTWTQSDGRGRQGGFRGRSNNYNRCFNCGQTGHRFAECPHEKKKNNF